MQIILILGASGTSGSCIDYLVKNKRNKWQIVVVDKDETAINRRIIRKKDATGVVADITNPEIRREYVSEADIVLSFLPGELNTLVAADCLTFKKDLIASSKLTPELMVFDKGAKEYGLLFVFEMGLYPGIDHMSAARLITGIERIAGEIVSFKTAFGEFTNPGIIGLNAWNKKVIGSTKELIQIGSHGARWREDGLIRKITYQEVFDDYKKIVFSDLGSFAAILDGDSLFYAPLYGIGYAPTFIRSVIFREDYVRAWRYLVLAELTTYTDHVKAEEMTFAGWVAYKTGLADDDHIAENFKNKFRVDESSIKMLDWLGLFQHRLINKENTSSGRILQSILEDRWKWKPTDKDMVVLQQEILYNRRGLLNKVVATMRIHGGGHEQTAFDKGVGLPIAILARKIVDESINPDRIAGVHIPVLPEIYNPVLKGLEKMGIEFFEEIS